MQPKSRGAKAEPVVRTEELTLPWSNSFWNASIVSTATMWDFRSSEALTVTLKTFLWILIIFYCWNISLLAGSYSFFEPRAQINTSTTQCRHEQVKAAPCCLLLKQVVLDVLQHAQQSFLHLSLWERHLGARVSPHCDTLLLLHVFGPHFQTDGDSLHETNRKKINN